MANPNVPINTSTIDTDDVAASSVAHRLEENRGRAPSTCASVMNVRRRSKSRDCC